MTAWHDGPLEGVDFETTGTDVEQDRVVTACYARQESPGAGFAYETILADPGIEIHPDAAKIHGITTEKARAEGIPAAEAVSWVMTRLAGNPLAPAPLVGYNISYDLTIADREARRHGAFPLVPGERWVIDPFVLDRALDKYRKGPRKLTDTCAHYGITLVGAHDAHADTVAAMHLARAIGRKYPEIGEMSLPDLHEYQVKARAEQAASLQKWKRANGEPDVVIDPSWPMVPWKKPGLTGADLDRDGELLAAYCSARAVLVNAASKVVPVHGAAPDEADRELVRAAHALLGAARELPAHLRPAGAAS